MKFARTLLRSASLIGFSKVLPKVKLNRYTLTASGLATSYPFWLSSQKIMSEEQTIIEIEDNIQEG